MKGHKGFKIYNYCDYCNSKNRKLQSGMIFKIKENNRNSMRLSDKTTKQKNYNREKYKNK